MKLNKFKLSMAVLLTAVLPFSNLWAEDKSSQNLGAEHRFSEMQNAYRSSNFELYFVKQSMATAEPISFSHGVVDNRQYSHWLYLNGVPMGYFSAENIIAYFRAGSQPELVERGVPPFLIGRFNTVSLDKVYSNYVPVSIGRNRIAGRNVFMVRLSPKKNDRYGYVLYIDEITKILLQVDVVNPTDGQMVESYMATHFVNTSEPNKIIQKINEAYLNDPVIVEMTSKNREASESVEGEAADNDSAASDISKNKRAEDIRKLGWGLSYVPSGYELVKIEKNSIPDQNSEAEHLLYTDGLSDLSVYRIKALEGSEFPVVKQGTTNLFRYRADPYEIVVVGDIPVETEKKIAESYSVPGNN